MRLVAAVAGAFALLLGVWAFFAPASFFRQIAHFPPYNRHLIHDIGAFNIGLGMVLLLALTWVDSLAAALAGTAVGAIFHFVAHVVDHNLGGRAADPVSLGIFAAVIALAALWRVKRT